MNKDLSTRLAACALGWPLAVAAQTASDETTEPVKRLGVVSISGRSLPTSLPTQIPTTMEGVTREQIEATVNATDSEDALRYFPSLLVRKRYIGDYNHAILSSRASGTGNSARSAVYADGILLSNYLGNGVGGLSFPPRWGLVTPEEIERVDVMYGPFSAAYPGNSVGAVVDYVTRMPAHFEAHAKVGTVVQPFDLYGTHQTYRTWQASASLGNRAGGWAWWVNVNRTDSQGQPLTFATRTLASGTPGGDGTPVSGAVPDANNTGRPWWVLGTGTQYHSVQDHLKLKFAYDIDPTLRASYVLGLWKNVAQGRAVSFLRDAGGQPVSAGPVVIDGSAYTLGGADFVQSDEQLLHAMHGLSVRRHRGGTFDWELAASLYDYRRDEKRQSTGTLADGHGTGWTTLALKGTWRPDAGGHVVDFGAQQERYTLRYRSTGTTASNVEGDTQLRSLWAQDTWRVGTDWKTVLGGRAEQWEARNGRTEFPTPAQPIAYAPRRETYFSPKAALSWQARPETVLKASLGRAVRMPTVGELYGATSTTNAQYINDPALRPERSWTAELSAERELDMGNARLTAFAEDTRDALYSQTTFDAAANRNVTRVQNIGRIATTGLEAALATKDWLLKGLELSGSLTYADSRIKENAGFVAVAGDTIGKWQPNIPRWRATALASYRVNAQWIGTLGARYSGHQYRTLDNSDVNGFTYMGVSRFFVVDARALYRIDRQWSAAFGIDNLNNDRYWNFHPYPQRSVSAELRFDL